MTDQSEKAIQIKEVAQTAKEEIDSAKVESFTVTEQELCEYRNKLMNILRKNLPACKTCIMSFQTKDKLKNHNETKHAETSPHECDICLCRFDTCELLQQHRVGHYTLYRCRWPQCDYIRQFPVSVKLHHYRTHKPRGGLLQFREFECDYCKKTFPRRCLIVGHIKRQHQDRYKVKCEVCPHKCNSMSALRKHMLVHLDPSHRKHECDMCLKRFGDRFKMLAHKRTHTGERPFKCDICQAAYILKDQLATHMMKHHNGGGAATVKRNAQPRTKPFSANRCFTERKTRESDEPWKCEECNKTFKSKSPLMVHIQSRHKREITHLCSICGIGFIRKINLQVHMHSHSSVRSFECNECGKKFKYQAGLWEHRQIHKIGWEQHKCSICGAKFTQKCNLRAHMRVHTKERPYECNACGKRFPWKRNLKNHFRVHTNEHIRDLQLY